MPSSGQVLFRHRDLTAADDAALTRFRRQYVGFVFQFYNLIPSLTARENVALVTEIASAPMRPEEALALVGLEARLDHFPAQLSGVEEQRVNIVIDIVSPYTQWQTLGDNYRIEARILVYSRDNVLKVPTSVLFRAHQEWMVFVVHDGRAQQRAVQLGRRNAVEAVVETSVAEGDPVIVYPSDAIRHGIRVKPR